MSTIQLDTKKTILANFNKGQSFTSSDLATLMNVQRSNITPLLTKLQRNGTISIIAKEGHTFIYKIAKFVDKKDRQKGYEGGHRDFSNTKVRRTRVTKPTVVEQPTIGITISANIPQDQLGVIIRTIKELDPQSSIEL